MFANALVVLGLRQDLIVDAIGEGKDGALDTIEILLDDYPCRSIAKHTTQHIAQFLLGLVEGRDDEHALAGSQSVGLKNVGRLECLQEAKALLQSCTVEGTIGRRRDIVAQHELLGEVLGSLQHRSLLRRADNGDSTGTRVLLEAVVDALDKRVLRANYYHIDSVINSKRFQCVEVAHVDGDILAHQSRTGIARGDIQFVTLSALRQFPCQRMLASTAS